MNGIAFGEINLKHRAKPLHHGLHLAPTKYFTQARDSGVAYSVQGCVGLLAGEQVKVRGVHFHGEPVPIEGAVMQNHVFAPAHAIENRSWARDGANRKSRSQRLAEGADVRLDSIVFVASAGRV